MILVLHQGAIGDFVLTLSVVQAVRSFFDKHPGSLPIETIASSLFARIAPGRSAIDAYISPELAGLHTLFSEQVALDDRLADKLKRSRCVLNFLSSIDDSIHRRLETATSGQVISVDPRPTKTTLANGMHITAQWALDIRKQGLDIGEPTLPYIRLMDRHTKEPRASARAACRQRQNEWHPNVACSHKTANVIIHPGSGGRDKCWPIENFITLADSLPDEASVFWMLGPAECEPNDERFDALHRRVEAKREALIIEPDLAQAVLRIAEASLYIGNDGGMTHVAAALGIPTVAIFTVTNPLVWRPLGEHVKVVASVDVGQACLTPLSSFIRTVIVNARCCVESDRIS